MKQGKMSCFAFVSGSWHGAWCWFKVIPMLRATGNRAFSVELPGHGRDRTPVKDVTMDSYISAVCGAIENEKDPLILVGHSRGGIVISQAAEKCPGRIAKLVYLCAFLIPNGEPMLKTALTDTESLVVQNLDVNESEGWHMLKKSAFRDALFGDCSEQDFELASSLLTPEPNAPVGTPLHLTEQNYGRIPRYYIETLKDRGISPSLQKKMYGTLRCQQVFPMNTSHSPFLSQPENLASILLQIAKLS